MSSFINGKSGIAVIKKKKKSKKGRGRGNNNNSNEVMAENQKFNNKKFNNNNQGFNKFNNNQNFFQNSDYTQFPKPDVNHFENYFKTH